MEGDDDETVLVLGGRDSPGKGREGEAHLGRAHRAIMRRLSSQGWPYAAPSLWMRSLSLTRQGGWIRAR